MTSSVHLVPPWCEACRSHCVDATGHGPGCGFRIGGMTVEQAGELREAKKRIRLLEQENEVLRRAAAYLSQANLPGK
jgi:transposase-like protein